MCSYLSNSLFNGKLQFGAHYVSRLGLSILLLSTFSLIPVTTALAEETAQTAYSTPNWLNKKMDLDCNGRPLAKVLEEVAEFFEMTVVYQAEGDEVPVWCNYSQSTAREILDRLFKKQNRALLIEDTPERKITVQVFGVSEYNVVSSSGNSETQTLPFLSEMTNNELVAMQNDQYELYRQEMKDPNAIVPGLDITRGDIQNLHREQNREYKKLLGDKSQVVAGMSITQQKLENLHEQQLKQYNTKKQSQDVADPLTGLTNAELTELHQQQINTAKSE